MEKIKDIKVILNILKTLFEIKNNLIGDMRERVHNYNINRSEFIALLNIYKSENKSMSELCDEMDLKFVSLASVIDNPICPSNSRKILASPLKPKRIIRGPTSVVIINSMSLFNT